MDFRIKQIRCFLVLAETLNFRKAADSVFVSQPTLSLGIKDMESVLGVKLFVRDRRGVSITPEGDRLVQHFKRVVEILESAKREIDNLKGRQELTLGIGAAGQNAVLPTMLQKMSKRDPALRVHMNRWTLDMNSTGLDGEVDALFMVPNLGMGADYLFHPIRREAPVAIIPASSRFAQQDNISFRDFCGSAIYVTPAKECGFQKWLLQKMAYAHQCSPDEIEIPSGLQMQMVATGSGMTIGFRSSIPDHLSGIKVVRFKEKTEPIDFGLVTRRGDVSPSVFRLCDVVGELYSDTVREVTTKSVKAMPPSCNGILHSRDHNGLAAPHLR